MIGQISLLVHFTVFGIIIWTGDSLKTLQQACKQAAIKNGRVVGVYNECPELCIAIKRKWGAEGEEGFSLAQSLSGCHELGQSVGMHARLVRLDNTADYLPIVSQFIPKVAFFVGAKRTKNGLGWHFGDYVYLDEFGHSDRPVQNIPASLNYRSLRQEGDTVDETSLKCLQLTCDRDASQCSFSRSLCTSAAAIVCQLFPIIPGQLDHPPNNKHCYRCRNGDLFVKLMREAKVLVSPGYPSRLLSQYMDCITVFRSEDIDFKPMINLTADIGCLKHVDDFVEIYQETDRISDARLVARLRSKTSFRVTIPSKVLIRYHSSNMVSEYSPVRDSHEIFVQPTVNEREELKLRQINTIGSALTQCNSDTPRGFRMEMIASRRNGCPKMFHKASWKWQTINVSMEHHDQQLNCMIVINSDRNRSIVLSVINANLRTTNDETNDFLQVDDGYEFSTEPLIRLEAMEQTAVRNVTNATLTDRMVIYFRLHRSDGDLMTDFSFVNFEFRMTSRRVSATRWRSGRKTRHRSSKSLWHFWKTAKDNSPHTHTAPSTAAVIGVTVAVLALGALAAVAFLAYYRRWPLFLRFSSYMGNRKIFHNEETSISATMSSSNNVQLPFDCPRNADL